MNKEIKEVVEGNSAGHIIQGNTLAPETWESISDKSVQCVVTSPPYWGLRDYGVNGQLGLEGTPEEYVAKMVDVFRQVRRVLRDDGTVWLNLGDSYSSGGRKTTTNQSLRNESNYGVTRPAVCDGLKPKDLVGIPWRVAFALQADGWYLRQDIIWHKPNPMPESVTDRCTKSHEYIFLLTKNDRYYYDNEVVKEATCVGAVKFSGNHSYVPDDRNDIGRSDSTAISKRTKRDVWTIPTAPFKGSHFAVFPPKLIEPCILAGSKVNSIVLDPFFGSGTTGMVANQFGRKYIGIELNSEYIGMAKKRVSSVGIPMYFQEGSKLVENEICSSCNKFQLF